MDRVASTIATNSYAQALAIIVAFFTAVIFLWNSRSIIIQLAAYPVNLFIRGVWIPTDTTVKNVTLSVGNPSYLVAILARHAAVAAISALVFSGFADVARSIAPLADKSALLKSAVLVMIIARNILALIVGVRLGEIMLITKHVTARIERGGA